MMAVILAGGRGSRLKPYTMTIPKPLLPLGDIPILEILLSQLAKNSFTKVIISLGHMAPIFRISIGNGEKFGLEIEYVVEEEPLGTAGPLRQINNLENNFLVLNGDILTTLNFYEIFKTHTENEAWATIGVKKREVKIDYGVVESDEKHFLKRYIEKPSIPYEVSMGINVINKQAVSLIPNNIKFDIPQLMTKICESKQKVFCYKTDCYWQDIGRFDDYQKASYDFVNNQSKFLFEN